MKKLSAAVPSDMLGKDPEKTSGSPPTQRHGSTNADGKTSLPTCATPLKSAVTSYIGGREIWEPDQINHILSAAPMTPVQVVKFWETVKLRFFPQNMTEETEKREVAAWGEVLGAYPMPVAMRALKSWTSGRPNPASFRAACSDLVAGLRGNLRYAPKPLEPWQIEARTRRSDDEVRRRAEFVERAMREVYGDDS